MHKNNEPDKCRQRHCREGGKHFEQGETCKYIISTEVRVRVIQMHFVRRDRVCGNNLRTVHETPRVI